MEIDKSLNAYFSDAFYCINCSYFYETYMYCTFHYFLLKIFEYHQALGLVPIPELEQRALTLRKQQSLDHVQVYLLNSPFFPVLFLGPGSEFRKLLNADPKHCQKCIGVPVPVLPIS